MAFAFSCLCVFLAAIVRGYSGFGFSLLAITSLSLVLPPVEIVPSICLLEIAASLHLLAGIWRDIHWRSVLPILLGCLVATPFGVYLLARVPAAPMQIGLAVFVIVATALLWKGYAMKRMPTRFESALTGAVSGFCNGAFGIGGPPVILLYFASPAGNLVGRASLIAFIMATDVIALGFQAREGLVGHATFIRALTFLPPLIAGVWLGARSFKTADPAAFRKYVLAVLAALALITAAKGMAALG
jgi:uncharacterized protein